MNLEISPRIDDLHCAKFKVDPGEFGLLEIEVSTLTHDPRAEDTFPWKA